MGRRTARVVPTADSTASSSNSSAVVFTPVLPVDHAARSGAASSAHYRDDGDEYVSHPPSSMRSNVNTGRYPLSSAGQSRWSWMGLLIGWGITPHNRMILCLLVARVALAPSRRIPTCRTCLTCLTYRTFRTYLTYHFNKAAPHCRVRHSLQPHVPWLALADSIIGAVEWQTV
jgi:hypothetical protein